MQQFRYQSLSQSGQPLSGVVAALDRSAAVRTLRERGETATLVEPADVDLRSFGKAAASAVAGAVAPTPVERNGHATSVAHHAGIKRIGRSRNPSLSRAETASFIRELATALEAGLPMMQALRTVRRQANGKAMAAILDHLIDRVEGGAPVYQAAREYGPPFDDLIIGMLRAADASGNMSPILHQLADLLDRSVELRREVMGATLYPAIVFGLILISAIILVTVLVPRLIAPLADQITMPLPTQIVLNASDFIASYWLWCLIGIGAIVVAWRAWIARPENQLRFDRFKLKLPLVGRLLRDVAVARFTRTLGTLTSAGLPILDALRITSGVLGNKALQAAIDEVQSKVTSGAALADPLERSGLFPPLLVQIVNLGERSGRLESMLLHAAGAFDRQVNNAIKLFSKALPPVLLIIMASLAGFVLTAILLPLLELQSIVG